MVFMRKMFRVFVVMIAENPARANVDVWLVHLLITMLWIYSGIRHAYDKDKPKKYAAAKTQERGDAFGDRPIQASRINA